ncbi:hypothetical protein [Candidatus Formimonas warabiya]|uniref:Uncharacterized protein n=1 Tax=Formimonas warabiya TaxID=1761012 RepID=A0A3G1KVS6_FORW1|nr:hypothetical protein [Candidatus Formimonas warabiya]ATW26325.1 hypothetical protein DCMF_17540 [Candidatus Formimonas warabiya]
MEKKYLHILIHVLLLILFFHMIMIISPIVKKLFYINIIWTMIYPFLLGLYLSYPNILDLFNRKEKLIVNIPNLGLAAFSLLIVLFTILYFLTDAPAIVFIFGLIRRCIGDNVTYFSLLLGYFLPKAFYPAQRSEEK